MVQILNKTYAKNHGTSITKINKLINKEYTLKEK